MAVKETETRDGGPTWIPRLAVCALVVPWDILDEVLQGLLVASLLALAEGTGHVHGRCRKGREVNCNRQCGGGVLRRWSLPRDGDTKKLDATGWDKVRSGGTIIDYCLGVLEADSVRFSGTPCRRGEEQQQEGRSRVNPYIVRQSNQILGIRGDSYGIRIGY